MARISSMLLAVLCLGCLACGKPGSASFKYRDFHNPKAKLVLGFDLRNDKQIAGGLVVNTQTSAAGAHLVVLPFNTKGLDLPEELLATAGHYSNHTILAYFPSADQNSTFGIGFEPILPKPPKGSDIGDLPPGVYFASDAGLGRAFVYKFGSPEKPALDLVGANRGLTPEAPEMVAVALPEGAKKLEMLPGRLPFKEERATTRFYSNPGSLGGTIQIQYDVPATPSQNVFALFFLKLFGALVIPLLTLIFLPLKDTRNQWVRKIWIWVLVTIEAALLTLLAISAFRLPPSQSQQLWLDFISIAAGAGGQIGILWHKAKAADKPPGP